MITKKQNAPQKLPSVLNGTHYETYSPAPYFSQLKHMPVMIQSWKTFHKISIFLLLKKWKNVNQLPNPEKKKKERRDGKHCQDDPGMSMYETVK